jgi:hypothetical protein
MKPVMTPKVLLIAAIILAILYAIMKLALYLYFAPPHPKPIPN